MAKKVFINDLQAAKSYAEEILMLSEQLDFAPGIAQGHHRLGIAYNRLSEDEKSREHYRKALVLFQQEDTKNRNMEGVILFNLGLSYKHMARYDSALFFLEQAAVIFEEVGKPIQKGAVLDGISGIAFEQGKHQSSLEYAMKAAEVFEEAGDELRLADASSKIGQAYAAIKNYPAALRYLRMSTAIYRENKDTGFEIDNLRLIGDLYSDLKSRDSAIFYFSLARELLKEYEAPHLLCATLLSIGNQFLELKQYSKALEKYEEVLPLAESVDNPVYLIPLHMNIGQCNYNLNKGLAKAEKHFLAALELSQKTQSIQHRAKIHRNLGLAYRKHGHLEKAYDHQYEHQRFKDSILDLQTREKIAELQTLYETEKKDREIEKQESEIKILNQTAKITQLNQRMLIGGVILSILLAIAIFLGYQQKIRRDRLLFEQEKQVYEQELHFNKKELATHTLHLVQKSDLLETLKSQMEQTQKGRDNPQKSLREMIQLIKSDKHVEQDWQNFKSYFDKVHEGFEEKLAQQDLSMSQNELRLAALMKMDLSTKEIAAILNISPDSVHKSRYRLKKRLGLGSDDNLRGYILSL